MAQQAEQAQNSRFGKSEWLRAGGVWPRGGAGAKCGDAIRLSEHIEPTDGTTIFGHAYAMGLEGIVAKRRDRAYKSGRSSEWVKIKNPAYRAIPRAELSRVEQAAVYGN